MKIGSPFPHKKARIEIIPLIDIMFFLLASFMLASLSVMRLQSIHMDLPTATVDKLGNVYIDKNIVSMVDLQNFLSNRYRINTNVPVYISGDKDATHGMIINVLDLVRRQGIQKVSFAIAPKTAQK